MCRERPPTSTIPSMMGVFAATGLDFAGGFCEHAVKLNMAGVSADMNQLHSARLHPHSTFIPGASYPRGEERREERSAVSSIGPANGLLTCRGSAVADLPYGKALGEVFKKAKKLRYF